MTCPFFIPGVMGEDWVNCSLALKHHPANILPKFSEFLVELSNILDSLNFHGGIVVLMFKSVLFMQQAVERLQVNPDLNRRCIGFLENAFLAMKSVDEEAIHSMLFVNSKLLSLFSEYEFYCAAPALLTHTP